ncbi:hypothetical protein BDQ17DRAFT_1099539 [Cyathus striatus]|nr:hypothetical protein BDQ17DRAFT_1099539 [Cyathus striatus]
MHARCAEYGCRHRYRYEARDAANRRQWQTLDWYQRALVRERKEGGGRPPIVRTHPGRYSTPQADYVHGRGGRLESVKCEGPIHCYLSRTSTRLLICISRLHPKPFPLSQY